MIFLIRGQKVMLDSDLAELYGVETKALNQAVKRNLKRFPGDFMFRLSSDEHKFLKSQFVTSKVGSGGKQKQPLVFTGNGVAMLSGILNSDRAINVNIAIMRIFTKLRSFLMFEKDLVQKIDSLELDTAKVFKIVFERLDNLEEQLPLGISHRPLEFGECPPQQDTLFLIGNPSYFVWLSHINLCKLF